VLEVGAGSGYQTALLTRLASTVFAVERVPALAHLARAALEAAGITTVNMMIGDGTLGWRAYAPYDAILVAAGSPDVPGPLVEQLAPGGRMVIPVGASEHQSLTLVERPADGAAVTRTPISGVRFVPLLGEFGHTDS
jgi:protein-L-isoaspartate(D-aspartate) O-methyltransferase